MLRTFLYSCWPLVRLLWKNVFSGPLPIFKIRLHGFFVFGFYGFLILLNIILLSDIWFASIFSHSLGCLFILLIVSFTVQTLWGWCCPCLLLLLLPALLILYPKDRIRGVLDLLNWFWTKNFKLRNELKIWVLGWLLWPHYGENRLRRSLLKGVIIEAERPLGN